MAISYNAGEPVTDDVEGHGQIPQHNEPVPEDDGDVEAHGILRNAALATAIAVSGGVAMASPAAADWSTLAYAEDTSHSAEDEVPDGYTRTEDGHIVAGDSAETSAWAWETAEGGTMNSGEKLADDKAGKVNAYASEVVPEPPRDR